MTRPTSLSSACARVAESNAFVVAVFVAIVGNAVVLGAQTYDSFEAEHGARLDTLNDVFLGLFVLELAIRIGAHGRRPDEFFRSGWNVFDFAIVAASFVPGVGQNTTLLRIVRLLRVVRLVSLLPGLRVLLLAVGRSIPPVLSISVMALLMLYVYGMIGWLLWGDELPEQWGDIGRAMLTLFVMLTLENLPQNLDAAMEVHPWSWVYFVTFALTASFLLLNVLIGVVINSMEEAREIEHEREREARHAAGESDPAADAEDQVEAIERRITALRDALADLEDELGGEGHRHRHKAGGPRTTG